MKGKFRVEKDYLGEKEIPQEGYWGIHTARALENFAVSGIPVAPELIAGLAVVKKAACRTNAGLGYLDQQKARAIEQACDEIIGTAFGDQFCLDALQGGAGTSLNMNMNEVVANRALEIMGKKRGDYSSVHPIADVNKHQSTNDVYPTALKIACLRQLRDLSEVIAQVQGALQKKEKEFAQVVKIGRTELQEAVPITLGAEFGAFAEAFARDRWRTEKAQERLRVVNIGATAVGTGLGAPRKYIFSVIEHLRELSGLGICRGENLLDATANADCFVEASGIIKAHASNLIKVSGDLRLMNLLGEIRLPAVQAGSSIMAGKINPVILEMVIQAGIKVIANDSIITQCCSRGSFQINEFLPLVAHAFLENGRMLIRCNEKLAVHIAGIACNAESCRRSFEQSPTIMTAFLPLLGYERIEELMKEYAPGEYKSLYSFLEEKLGADLVAQTLSAQNLISLGYREGTGK